MDNRQLSKALLALHRATFTLMSVLRGDKPESDIHIVKTRIREAANILCADDELAQQRWENWHGN